MPENRHQSLDMLRGFAILGILVMNIQAFAMPWPAYANPYAFGSMEGIHAWVYFISHVLFEVKFYSLFAMMFGAGLALMSERAVAAGVWASARHYRRMLFLALIGLFHGLFIWYGDILFMYAICGSLAWLFRKRGVITLTVLALVMLAIPVIINLLFGWSMHYWPEDAVEELAVMWGANSPAIQDDLAAYQAGYASQLPVRMTTFFSIITWSFLLNVFWNATGLMLLGMALYRLGLMTGEQSRRVYLRVLVAGLAVGLPLIFWGLYEIDARDWEFPWAKFVGGQFNAMAAPFMALAYLSAIMLVWKSGVLPRLQRVLAAAGQMALSNYLFQSLVCTLIFYGHGLALFGQVERGGQALLVLAIWFVQLSLSLWWLRHFRQGPVEWLWRSASRLERLPFRR